MAEEEKGRHSKGSTRRAFLKSAGIAAAGVLASDWARSAVFSISSPHVVGSNDRIRWGIIGCGFQGTAHIGSLMGESSGGRANCQIVAICDIYQPRKERAQQATGARAYHDYRQLLDDKDVDAVLIATPEHWHARMAINAMEVGKDVYLEKPMTRTLDEAKNVYDTVLHTKRVLQVGCQFASEPKWRRAHELLPKIGYPLWSQTGWSQNSKRKGYSGVVDTEATPANLDWKAFLGPAPKRPFDKERFFNWRRYWDYCAGITSDLFPHRLHPLFIVLGLGFPSRVACTGGNYVQRDREVPDTVHIIADFPSGHTMLVIGCTSNAIGLPAMVHGHRANMYLEGADISIQPERLYAEEEEEILDKVPPLPENPLPAHQKNFMECVRTRGIPNCGSDLAYPVMVTLALAEMSYRRNRMMRYDPEKR